MNCRSRTLLVAFGLANVFCVRAAGRVATKPFSFPFADVNVEISVLVEIQRVGYPVEFNRLQGLSPKRPIF
jgi:hypothetical protein